MRTLPTSQTCIDIAQTTYADTSLISAPGVGEVQGQLCLL